MLGQQANPDEVTRNRLQERKALHHSERHGSYRRPRPCFILRNARRHNDPMREPLKCLSNDSRKPTSPLNPTQDCGWHPTQRQRLRENPASSHSILNGKVDSHPTDRRHGVSGISDAEQPRAIPTWQPAENNVEQPYVVERLEQIHPISQPRNDVSQPLSESRISRSNFLITKPIWK